MGHPGGPGWNGRCRRASRSGCEYGRGTIQQQPSREPRHSWAGGKVHGSHRGEWQGLHWHHKPGRRVWVVLKISVAGTTCPAIESSALLFLWLGTRWERCSHLFQGELGNCVLSISEKAH